MHTRSVYHNEGLDSNADVVVSPQVSAGRIDLGIPTAELGKANVVLCLDFVASVARGDLVKGLALSNNPRHLRRRTRVGGCGGTRGGGSGTGDVHADVVIEPEVAALCWNRLEHHASRCLPKIGIRTSVGLRVPLLEVAVADAELRLNRVALITRGDLVELVTLGYDARHLRRRARVGGRRGTRGGGCRARDMNADIVVEPEVAALYWDKLEHHAWR